MLFESETFECVRGDLTQQLLTRINRTDAAHFYNLASLESTLLALMHITARYVTRRPDLRLGVSVNRTISSFSVVMNKSLWGLKRYFILLCVTCRPGWSRICDDTDGLTLCLKLLQNLLEVKDLDDFKHCHVRKNTLTVA